MNKFWLLISLAPLVVYGEIEENFYYDSETDAHIEVVAEDEHIDADELISMEIFNEEVEQDLPSEELTQEVVYQTQEFFEEELEPEEVTQTTKKTMVSQSPKGSAELKAQATPKASVRVESKPAAKIDQGNPVSEKRTPSSVEPEVREVAKPKAAPSTPSIKQEPKKTLPQKNFSGPAQRQKRVQLQRRSQEPSNVGPSAKATEKNALEQTPQTMNALPEKQKTSSRMAKLPYSKKLEMRQVASPQVNQRSAQVKKGNMSLQKQKENATQQRQTRRVKPSQENSSMKATENSNAQASAQSAAKEGKLHRGRSVRIVPRTQEKLKAVPEVNSQAAESVAPGDS